MADDQFVTWWTRRGKMVATVCGAVAAFVGVMSLAQDVLPAHRGYVKQETQLVTEKFNQTFDKLTMELKTLQVEQRNQTRESLRKEQFELEIKFREETNPIYKALIRQRMNQIDDALQERR